MAMAKNPAHRYRGFTLVELLTVVGIMSVLIAVMMPTIGRVRAASNAACCLARLRHMGTAWTTRMIEQRGRLPENAFFSIRDPMDAWDKAWPGIVASQGVGEDALLCPAAQEPAVSGEQFGFGNVWHAWNGKYIYVGAVRLDAKHYRSSSYGYNSYLYSGIGTPKHFGTLSESSNAPVFMDCAWYDVFPANHAQSALRVPPDLQGSALVNAPPHWRCLLARHGRGINVCMADGSARRVPLEELYMLTWDTGWNKYRLQLPAR
jgi:prepilin-type N-terminal cleavage/methylation domain-containing protein/prepilin-type processing-associated H-X9-DG protein